jgi:hypothetical protein
MIKLPKGAGSRDKKDFRKIMETVGTRFNIEGHMYAGEPAVYEVGKGWVAKLGSMYQMNVGYTGDTKMDLYTFDMMHNKTTATIKFAEVTVVSSPAPISAEWEVKEDVTIIK